MSFYFWLGDYHPHADETDGVTYFWLGAEAAAEVEDDGFITVVPAI